MGSERRSRETLIQSGDGGLPGGHAGADAGAKVDSSAAYLKLLKKGTSETIGTYLVDVELLPQPVKVDDKAYDLSLRFRRDYKPYSIRLDDVRALLGAGYTLAVKFTWAFGTLASGWGMALTSWV